MKQHNSRVNRETLDEVCRDCTDYIPSGTVICPECPVKRLKDKARGVKHVEGLKLPRRVTEIKIRKSLCGRVAELEEDNALLRLAVRQLRDNDKMGSKYIAKLEKLAQKATGNKTRSGAQHG